ncbi:acyltransferase [Photobacterium sp. CAU 1568]|uniref:Acyltransferase n=1 Tax=Photobacterium arenosum TaxID=2774143 RepID=A0ABR9BQ86_9GAMM|nr:acyltransferase [Photobacterium arenosum]MBD8514418.1 acyltransferase [Photobacterium arenosum]
MPFIQIGFLMKKLRRLINSRKITDARIRFGGEYYIEYADNIQLNGYVYVGPGAYWSAKGNIILGSNVIFGPKTTIWTYNHDYMSHESIPYGGEDLLKEVVIEDNVWVGLGAIILPGTIIREGAVIGAGSVVHGEVKACTIVAGNPAKVIGERDSKIYQNLKRENKKYLYLKS